ncbi:MAG: molybdate ABC transporter permease subunit, partial [Anaerolineae bacterium]|nr:molybdate ABC transporter permease subunit [Anaerolineae bacterium]
MLLTAAGLIALLLGLPLLVLGLYALQHGSGFDATLPQAIVLSLTTTLISAGLIAALGTPLAYVLARWRFPLRGLLIVLLELPVVLPPAVAGLALLITFGRQGALGQPLGHLGITMPFTPAAVVIAQVFVAAPFYIRSAIAGLGAVPRSIEDAARVDGAGGLMLFRRVTLPLAAPTLAAGLTMSWARALGEFGATILFAGSLPGRTQTMPLLIYNILERDIDAAVTTGLLLVALALM